MKKLRLTNVVFDETYYFIYKHMEHQGDKLTIQLIDEENFDGFIYAAAQSKVRILTGGGANFTDCKIVEMTKCSHTVCLQ